MKVHLFGFSVTSERDGYVPAAQKELARRQSTATLSFQGLGGAALNVVPFLFDLLHLDGIDILCLEVATCLRYSENNPAAYRRSLDEIWRRSCTSGVRIAFINLFRNDIDYSTEQLSRTIVDFGRDLSIPYLDLVPEMIAFRADRVVDTYLRDGIHPTAIGAQFYGARVADFVESLSVTVNTSTPSTERGTTKSFISASPLVDEGGPILRSTFSRSFIDVEFLTIGEGVSMAFRFPMKVRFHGFVFLTGPKAGWMRVTYPYEVKPTRRLGYNVTSYYRSISYILLRSAVEVTELAILTEAGMPDVILRKGEPDLGPRETQIAGFLIEC